jgi:hypothetical protein
VACPCCGYANDADFRFYQQCGYTRLSLPALTPEKKLAIDFASIETRLATLFSSETKYDKQKPAREAVVPV